jgi:hypothetical protein
MISTIKVDVRTKERLKQFKEHKSETYDEVINKLAFIAEQAGEDPELSKETLLAIEKARERVKKGQYYTEEQVEKSLGIK